ncbi:hypothetical protein BGY98DRAFT_984898, partial [Russula aff. rugulosa BPL654]
MTLWVAVGAGIHKNYERPTPYRCWISPKYSGKALVYTSRCGIAPALLHIRLYFWTESRLSVD